MDPRKKQRGHHGKDEYHAWNPGISSQIPARIMRRSTMFDASSYETSFEAAKEKADYCGLKTHEVALFSVERLIKHELLVRVTADLTVPDGPEYEELGINLRGMTATIYNSFVKPQLPSLIEDHKTLCQNARKFMQDALSEQRRTDCVQEEKPDPPIYRFFFRWRKKNNLSGASDHKRSDYEIAAVIRTLPQSATPGFEAECLRALSRAVDAVFNRLGYLPTDDAALLNISLMFFSNRYGGEFLGKKLQPLFKEGAEKMNYRFLPAQQKPVVMNVKGSSASGKSTLRPLQRVLAERIGIPWHDFALISPDYWRKYLLDYETLGEDYKYGGMLTGHELEIIDRKLDRYMAEKAANNSMPHLLIDRFRFDSFSTADQLTEAGRLLSRFGDSIYLFFMITPPEETVERAWSRGQTTGRYKAVDDLLYHNFEAYEGIKKLFFSWVLKGGRKVHYEFLDNSVPKGQLPKTVAFGWNNTMTIVDVEALMNIDRFAKVNVDASSPDEVYQELDTATTETKSFLHQCMELLCQVDFVDHENGDMYARLIDRAWIWQDIEYLDAHPKMKLILDNLGTAGWDGHGSADQSRTSEATQVSNHCIGKFGGSEAKHPS